MEKQERPEAQEILACETALILEEKEEKRLGLMHIKRNQFVIRITEVFGEKAETMEVNHYRRQMERLWDELSLVVNAAEPS